MLIFNCSLNVSYCLSLQHSALYVIDIYYPYKVKVVCTISTAPWFGSPSWKANFDLAWNKCSIYVATIAIRGSKDNLEVWNLWRHLQAINRKHHERPISIPCPYVITFWRKYAPPRRTIFTIFKKLHVSKIFLNDNEWLYSGKFLSCHSFLILERPIAGIFKVASRPNLASVTSLSSFHFLLRKHSCAEIQEWGLCMKWKTTNTWCLLWV